MLHLDRVNIRQWVVFQINIIITKSRNYNKMLHKRLALCMSADTAVTEYKRCTVPVSEAGLCVTHWASWSRFAANYIRLTFSRV